MTTSANTGVEQTAETQALEAIEKALVMVHALCQPKGSREHRDWIMSIPARPNHDPDLVISKALYQARRVISAKQTGGGK